MRCGLRPIAAQRHAAPTSPVALADVQEPQRAAGSFALAHQRKIPLAHEVGDRFCNGKQKRLGISPSPLPLQAQRSMLMVVATSLFAARRKFDLSIRVIPFEYPVDRLQLTQLAAPERSAGMITDERAEPFPQLPRLRSNPVKLPDVRPEMRRHFGRHRLRLLEPRKQGRAVREPLNLLTPRRSNRVEEIQREMIGDEESWGAQLSHDSWRPPRRTGSSQLSNLIFYI